MEIKQTCYKGTRIVIGDEKRNLINAMCEYLKSRDFKEISIPIIQYAETFEGKIGDNKNLMFNFEDRGGRSLCLAPEYTSVIQKLSTDTFKNSKDVKLFYIQECFRGEKPQSGRFRQFTQIGIEIINPTSTYLDFLINLSSSLISMSVSPSTQEWYRKVFTPNLRIKKGVKRGLDYYKEGSGFEVEFELLGAQKQICGGGMYDGGTGFAIGIDRILMIKDIDIGDMKQEEFEEEVNQINQKN